MMISQTVQLSIPNIQEELFASRLRFVGTALNELLTDVESHTLTRDELVERVKEVERSLKRTRQSL